MKKTLRSVFSALLITILLTVWLCPFVNATDGYETVTNGKKLPALSFTDIAGSTQYNLNNWSDGSYRIVIFGDCLDEASKRAVTAAKAAVEGAAGDKVKAVFLDINKRSAAQVSELRSSVAADSVVFACDADGSAGYLNGYFSLLPDGTETAYIPGIFITDTSGTVRLFADGYTTSAAMISALRGLGGAALFPDFTDYLSLVIGINESYIERQRTDEDVLAACLLSNDILNFGEHSPGSDNDIITETALSIIGNSTKDIDKFRKIYDWVAQNTYYDYDYYEGKTFVTCITATDVLKYKYTVCEGYANLLNALLRSIGIPSKDIIGYAAIDGKDWDEELVHGSRKDETNHKWNAVYIDGRWILVDVTWDSGNSARDSHLYKGPSTRAYFDMTVEKMSKDHKIIKMDDLIEYASTDYGFTYKMDSNGNITITGAVGDPSELFIPARLSGYPVTAIGAKAFKGCSSLNKVYISEGVKTIETLAFLDCTSLTEMTVPASVNNIGSGALGYNIVSQTETQFRVTVNRNFKMLCSSPSSAKDYASSTGVTAVACRFELRDAQTGILVTGYAENSNRFELETAELSGIAEMMNTDRLAAYSIILKGNGYKLPDYITVYTPIPGDFAPDEFTVYGGSATKLSKVDYINEGVRLSITCPTTLTAIAIIAPPSAPPTLLGDVDGNGVITTDDARTILRASVGLIIWDSDFLAVADYDGNGTITTDDARSVLRKSVGLI